MSEEHRLYDAKLVVTVKIAVDTELKAETFSDVVGDAERKARDYMEEALKAEFKESWPLTSAEVSDVLTTEIVLKSKEEL